MATHSSFSLLFLPIGIILMRYVSVTWNLKELQVSNPLILDDDFEESPLIKTTEHNPIFTKILGFLSLITGIIILLIGLYGSYEEFNNSEIDEIGIFIALSSLIGGISIVFHVSNTWNKIEQ